MATIDIHNLSGAKVGTLDLADEVFGAVNEDLLWEAVKHYRAAQRAGTHATKNREAFPVRARSSGSRRARGGPVLARSGRRCGGTAARCMDRNRAPTTTRSRKKKLLGALRSALAAKFADGKLIVVNTFDVKEPKTKAFPRCLEAESRRHGPAGRGFERREPQSGTEFAQYRRPGTGARERSASLSSAALRRTSSSRSRRSRSCRFR